MKKERKHPCFRPQLYDAGKCAWPRCKCPDEANFSDLERQMLKALWQAWRELNTIRARDGVPYCRDGWKSGVAEEYFSQVVDDASAAIEAATGRPTEPWMPCECRE